MPKRKQIGPTLIALNHNVYDRASLDKVKKFVKDAGESKRRLFIECPKEDFDKILKYRFTGETFADFMHLALDNGWEVIPIDRKIQAPGAPMPISFKASVEGDILLERYVRLNVREKYWARLIKKFKPRAEDFIVMHPGHIRGFLSESRIKPKKVVWLDKLVPVGPVISGGRLTSSERRKLKRRRFFERIKRAKKPEIYKKIKRKKRMI